MSYFVIATKGANAAQQNAITAYFHGKSDYGYWHWFPDVWLVDSNLDLYAVQLRDAISPLVPGLYFMVWTVEPVTGNWAGFGDQAWGPWLTNNWKKPLY